MSFVRSLVEFERRCEFFARCTEINKSLTVSNGVGASSFEIWTANMAQLLTMGTLTKSRSFKLEILQSRLPCMPPKNLTFRCGHFWLGIFYFFMLIFFSEKKSKPVGYTRTLHSQTWKNTKWAETFVWCLLLIFKVVYWDHLTQLLPFTQAFVEKGHRLVWGQVG